MKYAAEPQPFKFDLSQLVDLRVSEEWGEVKGRAQYADGENQYYIHYRAANGCATSSWFTQSVLDAVEDEDHPGCPVYGAVDLPEGAVAES